MAPIPPDDVRGPVRTYHPRRSVLGPARRDALAALWPSRGFSVDDPTQPPPLTADGALDTVRLFGRSAPVVLEIGSGMGEAVVEMAEADPARDYLAVEAHVPGVASLLVQLDRLGLRNVAVAAGDAIDLLRDRIAPGSLDAVHAYFPDPWPKARHHKRRLVAPDHVALIRSRLRPGGTLHCATDWPPYADEMLAVLAADGGFVNAFDGFAPRPVDRPFTKFERRALADGRPVADVLVTRTD